MRLAESPASVCGGLLLVAISACTTVSSPEGAGGAGGTTQASTSHGAADAGGSGGGFSTGCAEPGAPPSCPASPTPPCTEPVESDKPVWFDAGALDPPARVVGLSGDLVLIQTAPAGGGQGEPLIATHAEGGGLLFELSPVIDPPASELVGVALVGDRAILCGPDSCHVYVFTGAGLELSPAEAVPLSSAQIEGAGLMGQADGICHEPVLDEQVLCVHGDGVVCLVADAWITPLAPGGDRLLASAGVHESELRYAGESGRMGRVVVAAAPGEPGGVSFTWTELDRVTRATLRALGASYDGRGQIGGDDGALVRFAGDEAVLCDTGDQDWALAPSPSRLMGALGEVFHSHDPRTAMGDACLSSEPSELSFTLSAEWNGGTVWGLRYATQSLVVEELTGFTD